MVLTMSAVACGNEEQSMMILFGSFLESVAISCRGYLSPSKSMGRLSKEVADLKVKFDKKKSCLYEYESNI